jgi:hypothetical protein
MDEYEPHRPNYAELKNAPEEAQHRQQEQQAAAEPTRPDLIRTPGRTTDMGGMPAQQEEAIERNNQINRGWKSWLKDKDRLAEVQEQFQEQQKQMLQHDGGHNPPGSGGREH